MVTTPSTNSLGALNGDRPATEVGFDSRALIALPRVVAQVAAVLDEMGSLLEPDIGFTTVRARF